ncbi:hypothetical protein NIIDMKKI_46400 [Mycobacterium kansasii]|uniref:Uncharacterized protein n=1 Tax=Mycobacterium kansasii TaxID=1768 RepID=A0A7G1IG85_MYCKA|nr:hypothetical protein NIIDMKKI_46400 [Mycobacterium kansasii]
MVVTQHRVKRWVVGQGVERKLGSAQAAAVASILDLDQAPAPGDLQLGGAVQHDDPPVDHEGHPITQLVSRRHVVRGEKHRAATCFQIHDQVLDGAGVYRVQAGGRFVEKEQFGVVDQRPGERQAHLHALGILAGPDMGVVGQTDGIQQLHGVQGGLCIQRSEKPQILQSGELLIMVGQLERHADAFVIVRSPGCRVLSPDRDLTAVPAQQADENPLRRRLTRAAGA